MNIPWEKTFDILVIVFGSGGFLSLLYAKRERKAAAKEREANADLIASNVAEVSQKVYQGIISDLKKEVEGLRQEVYMLREVVQSYKQTCDNCPQRIIKRR